MAPVLCGLLSWEVVVRRSRVRERAMFVDQLFFSLSKIYQRWPLTMYLRLCTQKTQSIIEPSPAMIKALMRNSQPFHLFRKHLTSTFSQDSVVDLVENLWIVIDSEVVVEDWGLRPDGRHHPWRCSLPPWARSKLTTSIAISFLLVSTCAGCAEISCRFKCRCTPERL